MKQLSWIVLLLTISTFSQTPGGGVTDIDGNRYNSVIIGTQEWMKENLNVSTYTDGTPIPQVTDPTIWTTLTTGAWRYSYNDSTNGSVYGKLYNWYAVAGIYNAASLNDPSLRKQIAPVGWHVPTKNEWQVLIDINGGDSVAGGNLKEAGTTHWWSPNPATNLSGFRALPAGFIQADSGSLSAVGPDALFWTYSDASSQGNFWCAYRYLMGSDQVGIYSGCDDKKRGMSLRLLNNTLLNNQSFNSNSFNIYPNPAKDQITIDCGNTSNVIGGNYRIINMLGQEVQNGVLSSQQNIIALNNVKGQGVYFVKIYDSTNSLLDTKKIIIQQ
jgi:uncharacterized protein (TIGR02145 family)